MTKVFFSHENQGYRVSIKRSAPGDAPALYRAYRDRGFVRLFRSNTPQLSIEQLEQDLVARNNDDPAETGFIEFVIKHPEKGTIGLAVLCDYSPRHNRAEYLVGIFDEESRTTGLGIDATLLVLDLAFNRFGLNKVYAYSYAYNDYSFRSAQSMGFRHEATLRNFHHAEAKNTFVDLKMFSILREEFRTSKLIAKLSRRWIGTDITRTPLIAEELTLIGQQKQDFLEAIKNRFARLDSS